jgi:peptidoglycan/LPS O-acetylase OafA/YrhL
VRGLAALSVLLFHTWWFSTDEGRTRLGLGLDGVLDHFWLGVSVFFVLSGFLLYRPFATASIAASAWPSLGRYARARVLRILPAYWLVLTVVLALVEPELRLTPFALVAVAGFALYHPVMIATATGAPRGAVLRYWLAVAAHAAVLVFVAYELARAPEAALASLAAGMQNYFFLNLSLGDWAIVPAWTLAIEATFYATLPLLAAGIHRSARASTSPGRRAARHAALLVPLVALTVGYSSIRFAIAPSLPVRVLPTFVGEFALGMLIAVLLAWGTATGECVRRLPSWSFVAAAAAVGATATVASPWTFEWAVSYELVMAGAFALVIAAVVLPERPGVLTRGLRLRPLRALGDMSYGVYLVHFPLLAVLSTLGVVQTGGVAAFLFNAAIVAGVTFAAAWALWRYVEQPALRLKAGVPLRSAREEPALAPPAPV